MDYKMTVTIYDPKTEDGKVSDITYVLNCSFSYNPDDYGNGHYVMIKGKGFWSNVYDLRYDKTFHRDRKEAWLTDWAYSYWSGKREAYAVKALSIVKEG